MSQRRVLVIHSAADLYGASKNLLRSLLAFRLLGWTPYTILPHNGPLVKEIEKAGFEVRLLEHGVLRRKNMSPKGLVLWLKQLTSAFFILSKLAKQERFDLIYTNSNANIVGGLLSLRLGLPHIWHIHEIIEQPKWFKLLIELFIKWTGDQVFCVSEAVANNFSKIQPSRLRVIYNGIDVRPYQIEPYDLKGELGIPAESLLIGMIARVSLWKGQFYFLDIAAKLVGKYPDLHFVMAGDAFEGYEYLHEEIRQHIQRHNLEAKVSDLGFRLDVPEILSGLDIFVLPSILPDPLPTTVLEAMAAKKPVVATRHGGAVEMVKEGETGFLIPWEDSEAACVPIEKLIESKELRTKMGIEGHLRVKTHFNVEKYLTEFGNLVSKTKFR